MIISMIQNLIIGNFGNHSLAVMQALIEKAVQGLHFIYVDTGWAGADWSERVHACSNYARNHGVVVHALKPQKTFSELVIDRQQFPSPKFQWCATFLKGLTIINHLDRLDPSCEARIISGKRRCDSRRYANLQEFDDEEEFYQGRRLWYPLWQMSNDEFVQLIKRTGFELLGQPSLECSPCIYSTVQDLPLVDSQRLKALENQLNQTLFQDSLVSAVEKKQGLDLQRFDSGCGASWGCGE